MVQGIKTRDSNIIRCELLTTNCWSICAISAEGNSIKHQGDWQMHVVDRSGNRFSTRNRRRQALVQAETPGRNFDCIGRFVWKCRNVEHCTPYATSTIITDDAGRARQPIFITIREHSFAINLRSVRDYSLLPIRRTGRYPFEKQ